MKIAKITLHNFKCFEGTCCIDGLADGLNAKDRIILFGGMNGAGKTTLFESILLGLYGKKNKGTLWPSRGTKEDYENYIAAVCNNKAKSQELRTELRIELQLSEIDLSGVAQSLNVKRTWTIDNQNNTIHSEKLAISDQSSNRFDFVSEDDWEDFIDELIPHDISQFFFFDGEKIQDFVRDEDKEFARSLEKVLGITLYQRLNDDLDKVRGRIVRKYHEDEDAKIKLTEIERAMVECEKVIYDSEESIDSLKNEIREIEERLEEIDIETRRITRIKADTLDEYELEKAKLEEEKTIHEQKVFEAIQDELPFLITASLCEELTEQLVKEQELSHFLSAQKALEPKISEITQRLFEGEQPAQPISAQQKKFYIKKLKNVLNEVLAEKPKDLANVKMLHGLTNTDVTNIQTKSRSTHQVVISLVSNLGRLQEIEPKLRAISKTKQQAVDPEANKLYEERGRLTEKIEAHKNEIENLLTEIDIQKGQIASLKRQRTDFENKVTRTEQMRYQIEYTKRLRQALNEFSHRLRAQKVDRLQEYTLEMWHKLAHKKDQVRNIIINPDRQFSIDLYDPDRRLLDKTKLSAGEKELLAISLIWALSRLANRSLPVVIDTPLGRLDTIHRANIARHYFSNASHQVILLSTNTEIIGKEYKVIKPFVSKKYILQKDVAEETSRISEGYFE